MARIRTIKPEFPQSESMGRVSREARLCFVLLWTIADDAGRLRGNSRMLASLLYPYDDDAGTLIDGWLAELHAEGCLDRYEADGKAYIEIRNWRAHQKIDKPSASKIPAFGDDSRALANPREASSGDQGSRKGEDQGSRKGEGARARPELTQDLRAMAVEIAAEADPVREWDAYLDHAASTGREIHDLEAGWRGWLRKIPTFGATGKPARKSSAEPASSAWPELLERGKAVGVSHDGKEPQASFSKRVREAERAASR